MSKKNSYLQFGNYDFSNSGYVLMFQSFLFPIVLTSAGTYDDSSSQTAWALMVTMSSVFAVLLAPMAGKFADRVGKGKVFAVVVVITGLLAFLSPLVIAKQFLLLALSFVVFNTLFEISQSLYDSFLLNYEKKKENITSLSTFAWGFGYVGGALFAISYLGLSKSGLSESLILSILGLLYLLLSIPSILGFLKIKQAPDTLVSDKLSFKEIIKTSTPVPWRDLAIYWIIADSVAAVLYFAPTYMRQDLGVSTQMLGGLFLGGQLLAFPMTILMGKLANRFGAIKIVRMGLLIWIAAVIGLFFARSVGELIPVMIAFSFVIGSTQAILRAHYASRITEEHSGEGLGYFAIAQKSASIVSPALVAGVVAVTGSLRPAFLLLAVFIAIAFIVSAFLPQPHHDDLLANKL